MLIERPKDPNKVKGGQARQRQLRECLGEQGYRDYQKAQYTAAIRAHPDLHLHGAQAANAAQLTVWGLNGYVAQRQAAYRACQDKYGTTFARTVVRAAHEARRLYRLEHPTPGEAALHTLLATLGFHVQRLQTPFDYCVWCGDPIDWHLGPQDALAEGGVGPFYCDVLLPVRRLAIEVEGGIHRLCRERDARRRAFLEAQGLRVLVLTEDQALNPTTAHAALIDTLEALHRSQPALCAAFLPRTW
jgi:Protein of unknown function (DUF559)